jgi:hypothetical protein
MGILKVEAEFMTCLTSSGPENPGFLWHPANMLCSRLRQDLLPVFILPFPGTVPEQSLTLTLN